MPKNYKLSRFWNMIRWRQIVSFLSQKDNSWQNWWNYNKNVQDKYLADEKHSCPELKKWNHLEVSMKDERKKRMTELCVVMDCEMQSSQTRVRSQVVLGTHQPRLTVGWKISTVKVTKSTKKMRINSTIHEFISDSKLASSRLPTKKQYSNHIITGTRMYTDKEMPCTKNRWVFFCSIRDLLVTA
jgi:hypothetical protein